MNAEQRVLIIDSDLKNCKAIKYALTEYGTGAYYTLSVIDGIERLNRHNYELVILDISLSETDGLQLLRFMRLCHALNSLPDTQGRRIDAHIILGKTLREIAADEGVSVKCVSVSISRGLETMKKYLKNF
ncbi:hypothetical protein H8S75_00720 [Hungatella sp. L12]|uniref:Stage 0 sporulation protein A homolog n=1 Tax=Hungatella hominis TaxID=2763050 RepID=A0ABR7GZW9_9FIRM|nr:response regulator [Hungatella hominis]MBC5706484.1 hypothetical protein [Hungatella hominis]